MVICSPSLPTWPTNITVIEIQEMTNLPLDESRESQEHVPAHGDYLPVWVVEANYSPEIQMVNSIYDQSLFFKIKGNNQP